MYTHVIPLGRDLLAEINMVATSRTTVFTVLIVLATTSALFYFRQPSILIRGRLPRPLPIDYGNQSLVGYTLQSGEYL